MQKPIGVLYEHPLWFEPLFAELDRRGAPYERLDARSLVYDPGDRVSPYSLLVNRMSPSAWTRGHGAAIFHTLHYLSHLDGIGTRVLNGYGAFEVELSKARQCALFERLGIRYPRARAICDPAQAVAAAAELEYPVLVKPNVGGSGAGIQAFANPDELTAATAEGLLELGFDHTGLVQEQLPAEGGSIVRVEILDGRLLYAIRIRLVPGTFNLCPADYCDVPGVSAATSGRPPIEAYEPPAEVVEDARRIVAAARMDVGGVEYLVDARDGHPYFYDVNALSNFVADAPAIVGFDPFVDLVDVILTRAERGSRVESLARAS